jgi:hypothetical protein
MTSVQVAIRAVDGKLEPHDLPLQPFSRVHANNGVAFDVFTKVFDIHITVRSG